MRDHHHPRNRRRSFGSKPVVCVGRSSWTEAGIAVWVIPAQPSRWTSRGQGDVHCRLADLPTWSRMTTGVPARELSSGHSLGVSCTFNSNVEGSDSICAFRTRHAFPSSSNHPSVSSGITAGLHLLRAPLPTGNS